MRKRLTVEPIWVLVPFLLLAAATNSIARASQDNKRPADVSSGKETPASHELAEAGRIKSSAPPPMIVAADTRCDANGNIFAAYGSAFSPETYAALRRGESFPISKISADNGRVVQFSQPRLDGYAQTGRPSFYADPRGRVYALIVASRKENWSGRTDDFIVKYKDDGTVDSLLKLEPPRGAHFDASRLAAFLDGNFLEVISKPFARRS